MKEHCLEKFFIHTLAFSGLIGLTFFALWWFHPSHIVSLPLYILVSLSLWFFILRSVGYWFLLTAAKKPAFQSPPDNLSVDVFTTAASGEPIEMTQSCLLALKNMRYPHKTFLLDDSHNPLLKDFCHQQNIGYITRHDKQFAKCGNVNNGLRQSDGEFVLIVDPDHIVEPHFLDRVLGYFNDPEVGFVQTAQAYHNQEKSFVAKAGAEQTYLFYGPVLTAMGALGASLSIGTNCTFRRKALESIGLYQPGLAEDLHTSMAIHSRGWKSVYVPEILARGLTPEDLASYFHQQLKWSRGVLELLLNRFAGYAKTMSWLQRSLYVLSMSFYFESIMMAVNMLLPLLYLWMNQTPTNFSPFEFFFYLSPWLFNTVILFFYSQRFLCDSREKGLMWRGLILQILSYPIHILGIVYALIGKQIPYLPTAKAPADTYPLAMLFPQILIVVATLLGFAFGLCQACAPVCWGILVFSLWNITLVTTGLAMSYASHQKLFERPLNKKSPLLT